MIKITDITLSCIDLEGADRSAVREFYTLLLSCGADFVQVDEENIDLLGGALDIPRTAVYINNAARFKAENYKDFKKLVTRYNGFPLPERTQFELQLNDIREIGGLDKYPSDRCMRITGMEDFMLHDYIKLFSRIKKKLGQKIELCPQDGFGFATATAVEWLMSGARYAAASFLGVGGHAATEEVVMAVRINAGHRTGADLSSLKALAELYEHITHCGIPPYKAVVGRRIFHVESGIHVNGILKNASYFEPFDPASVGAKRSIFLGKHSGKSSVSMKLRQFGFDGADAEMTRAVLGEVKRRGEEMGRCLCDWEFLDIVSEYQSRGEVRK